MICLPRGYQRPGSAETARTRACPRVHPTPSPLTGHITHAGVTRMSAHFGPDPLQPVQPTPPSPSSSSSPSPSASSLPRPIGPDTLQSEPRSYLKPSDPIRGSVIPLHPHCHRQQIDARRDHPNEGGSRGVYERRIVVMKKTSDKLLSTLEEISVY